MGNDLELTFPGWYLYPSLQMLHCSPDSSARSTNLFSSFWSAFSCPWSLALNPKASSCLALMAMASFFFSVFVCSRTSFTLASASGQPSIASRTASAREPTCSSDETCSICENG